MVDEKNEISDNEPSSIQVTAGLRRRMKILCALEDITYEKLIEELVEEKEREVEKKKK